MSDTRDGSEGGVAMHWQMLIALVLAVLLGMGLRWQVADGAAGVVAFADGVAGFCDLLGRLFLGALKMLIVPLVVSSVIAGIGSLGGVEGFGRLGLKTLGFYVLTTALAVTVGITLVNVVQPGLVDGQPNAAIAEAFAAGDGGAMEKLQGAKVSEDAGAAGFGEFFLRLFPENVVAAAADNGQMLGLIVFSLLFALAMARLQGEAVQSLQQTMVGMNEVVMRVTEWVMMAAPIGVFGLMVKVVFETGPSLFAQLLPYFLTVVGALSLHMFVMVPLLLWLIGGVSPWQHFARMRTALLTAFSTASSAGTLPVTMRCVQENAGVSKRTSSFTLPLGATVNMDGTALYECVAVMFVAQVMGVELGLVAQVMVVLTALLTSIGVAGIPSASLVAILLILETSGIEGADAAVLALLSVDRLLDMSRTAVNVWGDSSVAVLVESSEKSRASMRSIG